MRNPRAATARDTLHVDVEHEIPGRVARVDHPVVLTRRHPGVVVQHVHLPERALRLGEEPLDVGRRAHVAGDELRLAARRPDLRRHLFPRRGVDVVHDDRRPLPREQASGLGTKPGAGASDDGDFSIQTAHDYSRSEAISYQPSAISHQRLMELMADG
jgi:hypothetical protein